MLPPAPKTTFTLSLSYPDSDSKLEGLVKWVVSVLDDGSDSSFIRIDDMQRYGCQGHQEFIWLITVGEDEPTWKVLTRCSVKFEEKKQW